MSTNSAVVLGSCNAWLALLVLVWVVLDAPALHEAHFTCRAGAVARQTQALLYHLGAAGVWSWILRLRRSSPTTSMTSCPRCSLFCFRRATILLFLHLHLLLHALTLRFAPHFAFTFIILLYVDICFLSRLISCLFQA